MDFRRFVQFALQGSSNSEQNAILLARVTVGLFFASSGANKLFAVGGLKLCTKRSLPPKSRFPVLSFLLSVLRRIGGEKSCPGQHR